MSPRCIINLYIGIPFLILVAILQSTILPEIRIFGLVPNLTLLTVLAWSYYRGPNEGVIWGMIGGLLIDLASGAPTGISSLPLMLAALVTGLGRSRIYSSNLILPALISLLSILLYQTVWLLLLALVGQPVSWRLSVIQVAAPLFLLNLLLMPLVYFVMARLASLVQGSRVSLG